jgi:Kef-type K+ transport system membrane component KefB
MPVIIASEASTLASETLFVLAVVVIAGPLLAEKARLPGLIGFMLGGTLLGPYVLGFLDEGQFDGIGGLGILYLMFLAGLELDMDIFQRYRSAAGQFGLLTFGFPFLIGWWGATQMGMETPSAILLGSIWASHTLVALPIIKRAGLSGSRVAAVAAGATIITDTLALIVLAVITSGAAESGGGAADLLRLLAGLAGLIFVTLWLYPRVGSWFFAGPGNDRSLRFMFLLGAMALGGLLAELAGMEGIVGAFFAGLGLNRLVPKRSNLMEKIEFVGSALFIPAFLISVGMLIDPSVLFDSATLAMAAGFLAIVAVGKALAAVVAGKPILGFSWSEIGLLFSLTIGQAAATLAAALVGFSIGLFSDQVINAVVLTVLFTVLGSSILTNLFSRFVQPEQTIERPIGSSVIAPIPPGIDADAVLQIGGLIARAGTGTVSPMVVVPAGQFSDEESAAAKEAVEAARLAVSASGAEAEGMVRVDSSLKSAVLNVVAERDGSMILLVAPRGRRLAELAFGGPIHSIGGASPVPTVLAVGVTSLPERLLVVVPGRPRTIGDQVDSRVALDITRSLSEQAHLPVMALVGEGSPIPELPEGSEVKKVSRVGPEVFEGEVQAGDLIIAPLTSVRRFMAAGGGEGGLGDGFGLLIAAGPHRLRREGTEAEEVGTLLGYSGL